MHIIIKRIMIIKENEAKQNKKKKVRILMSEKVSEIISF